MQFHSKYEGMPSLTLTNTEVKPVGSHESLAVTVTSTLGEMEGQYLHNLKEGSPQTFLKVLKKVSRIWDLQGQATEKGPTI